MDEPIPQIALQAIATLASKPEARILKESPTEIIRKIEPLELLKRWVNFQLKKSGQSVSVSNFSNDFTDSVVLTNILGELSPRNDFYDVYLEPDFESRAKKLMTLVQKTTYKGYKIDPTYIIEGNSTEIIKFLAGLVTWKPNLRTKTSYETLSERLTKPNMENQYKVTKSTSVPSQYQSTSIDLNSELPSGLDDVIKRLQSRRSGLSPTKTTTEQSDQGVLKKVQTSAHLPIKSQISKTTSIPSFTTSQRFKSSNSKYSDISSKNNNNNSEEQEVEEKTNTFKRLNTSLNLNAHKKPAFLQKPLLSRGFSHKFTSKFAKNEDHSLNEEKSNEMNDSQTNQNPKMQENLEDKLEEDSQENKIIDFETERKMKELEKPVHVSPLDVEITPQIRQIIDEQRRSNHKIDLAIQQGNERINTHVQHFTNVEEVIKKKKRKDSNINQVDNLSLITFANLSEDIIFRYFQMKNIIINILALSSEIYPAPDQKLKELLNTSKQIHTINTKNPSFLCRDPELILFNAIIYILMSYNLGNLSQSLTLQIQSTILQMSNTSVSVLDCLTKIKDLLLNNHILKSETSDEFFSIESLFFYYLFSLLIREEISNKIFQILSDEKLGDCEKTDPKIQVLKSGIHQTIDRFLSCYVDFEEFSETLTKLFFKLGLTRKVHLVKSLVADTKKKAVGETIKSIIDFILSEQSLRLIKESLEGKIKDTAEFQQSIEKGKEYLGHVLSEEMIEYFTAAIDPNNCRESVDHLGQTIGIFVEQIGEILNFIKFAIGHEVTRTINPGSLFRSNDISTKLMTKYAMIYGHEYIKKVLANVTLELNSSGLSFEMDPYKLDDGDDVNQNISSVKTYFHKFLRSFWDSPSYIPDGFRVISSTLKNEIMCRFPDNISSAVGGFIFLRVICPIMVSPDRFHIIDVNLTEKARRGLLLLSTIIQALSNGITFSSNRGHMQVINDDIINSFAERSQFINDITNIDNIDAKKLTIPRLRLQPPNEDQPVEPHLAAFALKPISETPFLPDDFINKIHDFLQGFVNSNTQFVTETSIKRVADLDKQLKEFSHDLFVFNKTIQPLQIGVEEYKNENNLSLTPSIAKENSMENIIQYDDSQTTKETTIETNQGVNIDNNINTHNIIGNDNNNTLNNNNNSNNTDTTTNNLKPIPSQKFQFKKKSKKSLLQNYRKDPKQPVEQPNIETQPTNQLTQDQPKKSSPSNIFKPDEKHDWKKIWFSPSAKEGWVQYSQSNKKFKKRFVVLKFDVLAVFKKEPSSPQDKPLVKIVIDSNTKISQAEPSLYKKKHVFLVFKGRNKFQNAFSTDQTQISSWLNSLRKARSYSRSDN
ncbi:ras gtpase-activating protein [Anaeramoeba ignava]|uniref:Ras gtpase-activating protein n=1 Tax=Anaeramoeba ignava TaxID=1746090 RepID=A0A9Q0L8Y5_ANAIG|nr:ras gtpase-activating protein [Anaeramoeba ignava]